MNGRPAFLAIARLSTVCNPVEVPPRALTSQRSTSNAPGGAPDIERPATLHRDRQTAERHTCWNRLSVERTSYGDRTRAPQAADVQDHERVVCGIGQGGTPVSDLLEQCGRSGLRCRQVAHPPSSKQPDHQPPRQGLAVQQRSAPSYQQRPPARRRRKLPTEPPSAVHHDRWHTFSSRSSVHHPPTRPPGPLQWPDQTVALGPQIRLTQSAEQPFCV